MQVFLIILINDITLINNHIMINIINYVQQLDKSNIFTDIINNVKKIALFPTFKYIK